MTHQLPTIRFRFELRPLAEVVPWGGDQPRLSWFSLTDGWYWIELGEVDLLRYVPEEGVERPYVDYYVVRFWEDLLQLFPAAIEDVPAELVDLLKSDSSAWPDPEDPVAHAVSTWYSGHFLDVGYLSNAPTIRMWRHGDQVTISWEDSDPSLYTASPSGEATVGLADFVAAVEEFDRSLMAAMEARVAEVVADPPAGIAIDLPHLRVEQQDRATWLAKTAARTPTASWPDLHAAARTLLP